MWTRRAAAAADPLSFPPFLAIIGINQMWPMATFKWYKWPIRRGPLVSLLSLALLFARASVRLFCGPPEQIKRVSGWQKRISVCRVTHISTGIVFPRLPRVTHMHAYKQKSTRTRTGSERERESRKKMWNIIMKKQTTPSIIYCVNDFLEGPPVF